MASEPTIFICNDDGVEAPGLRFLIESVSRLGKVIAVAPSAPRSGQSSAITVDSPLRITRQSDIDGAEVYSVNGTPVDCVKLAMHTILSGRHVDILLSGINHGSNAGNCVVYSGTMGAAFEGCMLGIPSIGFSLLHHSWSADFTQCGPYVTEITQAVLKNGLPKGICLNVNIPAKCVPNGMKVVRAGEGYWTEEYADYKDPQGKPFHLLTGRYIDLDPKSDSTDTYWLDRNFVTVVPVRPDPTAIDEIDNITQLLKN
ncbi:MAG: 5'/3'-nucleotidase SurE [Firmicutes bacterium]|nr:5'/3'-nucleotidase SurE [Bacillota bacterium]MCM1400514.1 5'/3'-nucleotidase SurE [Bacteroides sp.]MCM1476858.1 5'/3'-nucleotidase SurE [Bacteroides sp.]